MAPLYRSVPRSVRQFPDPIFYELLVLVDAIRSGRARERNLAAELLKAQMQATGGKMDELQNKGYLILKMR